MFKMKLIIADPDSRFLDKLTDFIKSTYNSRIKVSAYTKVDLLEEYLNSAAVSVDILLAHPDFVSKNPTLNQQTALIVVLSDGSIAEQLDDYAMLYKYQPGDKLINQLLNIYSEKNNKVANLVTGLNDTKLISVYSPVGGAGKTSVLLGMAVKLSEAGKSVFCLSLESLNSISAVLTSSENDAMSNILLSLNESADKLPLKFELYKTKDLIYHIDHFEPPECFTELSEITIEALKKLLIGLKQLSTYDYILIDMDSKADEKAITVFECSDKIVYVQVPDGFSKIKTNILVNQLSRTGIARKINFFEKLIPILNKYNNEPEDSVEAPRFNNYCTIPILTEFWSFEKGKMIFDMNHQFCNRLVGVTKIFD